MPSFSVRNIGVFTLCGLFFILDRVAKQFAHQTPDFMWHTLYSWFGWEYFENIGVAFGIRVPLFITAVLTPIILLVLIAAYSSRKRQTAANFFGLSLIFFGAISNFIDRLYYGFVIDYIRLATSIVNLADVMILSGVLLLFFTHKSLNKPQKFDRIIK